MSGAARRKSKIKPPKKHGPEITTDETWALLSNNIREIHKNNVSNLSFEENHRYAYNMVLYNSGNVLYKGVCALVVENLNKLATEQLVPAFPTGNEDLMQQCQEGETLLKALRRVWDDHTGNMSKLSDILKYMDRVYTQANGVPETLTVGLELFVKHIICPPIDTHIISAILKQIRIERCGYTINRSAVKECVDILVKLGSEGGNASIYKQRLEPVILSESETFYATESNTLMETCDAGEVLRRIERRFDDEEARTHHYLSSHTANPLCQILEQTLITPNVSAILVTPNSGLYVMIDDERRQDLTRLYTLFAKVPTGLPSLQKMLKQTIISRGRDINQASIDPQAEEVAEQPPSAKFKDKVKSRSAAMVLNSALKWVQDVLDLKDKFDGIWKGAFQRDRGIESLMNDAFQDFVNSNEKSAEFISLFIDDHLKKGLKGKTELEVDIVLDKTITVFRFVTDKDVFERYYKGHLAKRLLSGRSVSDDAERGMLAKLKIECGYQFTQKLEGMFNDMKLSGDINKEYQKYLAKTTAPAIAISCTVMTSTYWPMSQNSPSCSFPEVMLKSCQSFERFYLSKHSGRRLTWQPSLGNSDVKVNFKTRQHELNVSTFALVILLLFDELATDDVLTYEEIKLSTNIEDTELQRQLQSLACAKYKILKKHPPGRDVDARDSFSFNNDFTSPLQKIKISTIASRVESGDERKKTLGQIDEERRHQIEACIVRIMKDRKNMTHNALVTEATRQLSSRFHPNPVDIKRRIEGLIERDYLARCDDRKGYNYVA